MSLIWQLEADAESINSFELTGVNIMWIKLADALKDAKHSDLNRPAVEQALFGLMRPDTMIPRDCVSALHRILQESGSKPYAAAGSMLGVIVSQPTR